MAARLTPLSKGLITIAVLGGVGAFAYKNKDKLEQLAPGAADKPVSNVPPPANLPEDPGPAVTDSPPGCSDRPEVRFYIWAWNAQAGLILANGGKQAVEGSLMCKYGVNLKLIREDNTDQMQALMATFAEGLKKGEANPANGAHFVGIMGDGSATFLKALNDRLRKLGPDYTAEVVGSGGYSRGEDKLMGQPAWKADPQKARGGLVAGVLRDGDWNIALKWLGDNKIPNNPDEKTWDPDALNWVGASDYIDAAQKYVSGYCADLKNTKTGKTEKHCVDGVVTWTPGDVTAAEKKGGLVSIVSTKEYRSQMPHVIIGNKKWINAHRDIVKSMLRATFEGGDLIKHDDDALRRAMAISALVYKEKDGNYWYKYFHPVVEKDAKGLTVELGGSAVNNLADNQQLFGLVPGSTNIFAATYTVFGNIVKSQYPKLVPSFDPFTQVLDASLVKELAASAAGESGSVADLPAFTGQRVQQVVSRRSWDIQFATGSAKFKPQAIADLKAMFADLVVASGTIVELHGHTDDQGSAEKNQRLSEDRAFAVKKWLQEQSPTNFPDARMKVFAHGSTEPLDSNATAEGRAKNRRVEMVLGTAKEL
jgi:outer membrane protein OmpA-like peptidoglycan-associated protein